MACFAALLLTFSLPAAADARPGDLDLAFGSGGRTGTVAAGMAPDWLGPGPGPKLRPDWHERRVHLAAAPDGSFVVARGNVVFRYLASGVLDGAFGEAGRLAIDEVDGLPFGLQDIEIDHAGRVVVFGTTVDPSTAHFIQRYTISEVSPSYVTVLRFDTRGKPDAGFGDGDGVFRSGLGITPPSDVPADKPYVEVASAALDAYDRPVMAVGRLGFPPSVRSSAGWEVDVLARLTPAGNLDPTFGGGDGLVTGILRGKPRNSLRFDGFCISGLERPVIAARVFTFSHDPNEVPNPDGWLSRFLADGTPDQSFGRNGVSHAGGGTGPMDCTSQGNVFLLQPSQFIYLPPRTTKTSWNVVKRTPSGHVNRRFSNRAKVTLGGGYSLLTSLAVDPWGRTLLAGTTSLPKRGAKGRRTFFTVIRLRRSGDLDRRFGSRGWVRTGFGQGAAVTAEGTMIDPAGNLVVAGNGRAPWLRPGGGAVLARYLLRG